MDLQQQNTSHGNFESCIKCTICTIYCPVTAVNPQYPGPKRSGPDGERYRLKKPDFYQVGLKYCLNCKRCEVSCPADVKIADLIVTARNKYTEGRPSLRDTILSNTDFMGKMATTFAPIVNPMLRMKLTKVVMDKVLKIDDRRTFPSYAKQRFTTWFRKNAEQDQEQFNRHITYFYGCYVDYNYPTLGKALVRVLNALGYGVHLMEKEKCCGVAKIINRCVNEAKRDAMTNLEAIRETLHNDRREAVLLTSSTCCFTLRDEYPNLLGLENEDVRENIELATRFIYRMLDEGKARIAFRKDFKGRASYHVPCHMEKLGWQLFSSELVRSIPGFDLMDLRSHCCGIAGTYGFKKEYYDFSQAIGEPLFKQILSQNPDYCMSDCETCKWQIEMSTGLRVYNPIEILADAIDYEETRRLNGF